MPDPIIEQFTHAYNSANEHIHAGRYDLAQEDYTQMLELFHVINDSNRESIHKELSHSCLQKIYDQLQTRAQEKGLSRGGIIAMMVVSILVVLAGVFLIIHPSLVGLTIADCAPVWQGPTELYLQEGVAETLDAQRYTSCPVKTVLVTQTHNVRADIDGSTITFQAFHRGYEEMTILLVSHNNKVSRVPLALTVVAMR